MADTPASVLTLPPDPTSSRRARRFTAGWCAERGIGEDTADVLLLLVAELVTNAVLYGRSDVVLSLTATGRRVRLSVGDENTRLPQRREADPDALNGRGLVLVEALSARHGIEVSPIGKTVWCDVEVTGFARVPRPDPRWQLPAPAGRGVHQPAL